MTTLKDVINNQLQVPYGDIGTSQLAFDEQLCREIQTILKVNNFYHFTIDGLYGKITREALRDFKEAFAISGGDILGPTTAQFLLNLQASTGKATHDFSTKQGTQKAIIHECKRRGLLLNTQIAYVLATVEHETAFSFKPVEEAFFIKPRSRQMAHLRTKSYFPYYGRGYVQLTWKYNYEKYTRKLGTDLVSNPDKVMEPNIALFILVDGILLGEFTGKKLGTYVNGNQTDFLKVRRVINGDDKAKEIKNLANAWLSKLNAESVAFEEVIAESSENPELAQELLGIEELTLMQIMSS
ncbi:glycoside hydrolase family 19 protein [Geminocystis sp. NIES-3709]|uniref:glycoside hydrolase family 19 protein n=1 Tax=Geminocystis sp. NIES-3709 TaxID=1617448 RepID=UPI0005FC3B47|nr:glycoside hydrolase family 19 protein [Geminocystis sp. NIES-3709]BAQ67153.1 carboxypeptidase [Geminocystis sp. NIES-3709]